MTHKYLIILIFFSTLASTSFAQGEEKEIYFTIQDTLKGQLPMSLEFQTKHIDDIKLNKHHRLLIESAEVEQGDLIVTYYLSRFPRPERKAKFKMGLKILRDNGTTFLARPEQLKGKLEQIFADNKKRKYSTKPRTIIWEDFIEDYQLFKKENFSLVVEGVNQFTYLCKKPIPFDTWKKGLPHLIGIGIGGGLLAGGYSLKAQSNDLYETYRKEVFLENFDIATEKFGSAKSKANFGRFLRDMGVGVIVANTIFFTIRHIVYNRKKEEYEYYCKEKIQLKPKLDWTRNYQEIGMQLTYNF